jgi:hypothetical protein
MREMKHSSRFLYLSLSYISDRFSTAVAINNKTQSYTLAKNIFVSHATENGPTA